MQAIILYRFNRSDGGITVSPDKPETDNYTETTRLVADEGKLLTKDGINYCLCIDIEDLEGWYEVDDLHQEDWLKG